MIRGRSLTHHLGLLVLPLVFLAEAVFSLLRMPPVWSLYTDPSYQYLLNGLAVTVGAGPGHTDHPGTSLQWLVGFVNWITHSVAGVGTPLIEDVVSQPEHYLLVNALVLVLLQSAALWLFGVRLRAAFGLGSALIAQAAVVGTAALYPYRLYVIPEALAIACALTLLALVAPSLRHRSRTTTWQLAASVGLIMAIGVTDKVIFIPLLVIPLFLFGWRPLLQIYGWFTAGVIVIMWVTRDQLQKMWDWYTAVATTSARYPDEPASRSLAEGLRSIPGEVATHYPVFILALVLLIIGLWAQWTRRREPDRSPTPWTAIAALLVAAAGTLAMTYKAYRVNDLPLLAPLAGALCAVAWSMIEGRFVAGNLARRRLLAVPVVLAIMASVLGLRAAASFLNDTDESADYRALMAYLDERVAQGATIATGYGVFNEATSLYFANEWTRNVAGPEIVAAHPNWLDFSIWNGFFYTYGPTGRDLATCPSLAALASAPAGFLWVPGRSVDLTLPNAQYQDMRVVPERVFGGQIAYRIQSVTCGD